MRRKKKNDQRLKNKSDLKTNMNKRVARYKRGFDAGYQQGLEAGYKSFESYFEGTSIIIPSDNEVEYVKQCIESIINHTDLPYEIIVVDNNSSDGMKHYMKQLDGFVRYQILSHNHGFAGAVNRGLMMAKGTTILLLSNHAVCTDNWLNNMLICLQSNSSIGMVGPVLNEMNGSEMNELNDSSMDDLQKYETLSNQSDSAKWSDEEILSQKCLLLRRDLLEKVGFLDEGCLEGSYVIEDYCIRVKLQGLSLVHAGDAFVHLASDDKVIPDHEAEAASEKAMRYYTDKWNEDSYKSAISNLLSRIDAHQQDRLYERKLGETTFYPQAIAVKGLMDTIFWIEDDVRRPIEGIWDGPVIQLSQMDLKRWLFGPVLTEEEALFKLEIVQGDGQNNVLHGSICVKADGCMYYMEKGMKRAIVSPLAAEAWFMNMRSQISLPESQLHDVPDGLPIIGPVRLRQAL
ncbi:glycosyltransferase family 2 protein [Paenibacillus sp. Soil522]|uniref:glycosyltransferase family 2 protein n=1 Tax=Paenibacillus sp. Soil522 TaxID=1736388 RepID=UPI0007015DE5|nr:glycosyltransferase [Paenibacillus sp. Soil522]KRE46288.1 hypothetical protein ASG81_11830 [Paenibacillus sp. Soil522]